MEQAVTALPWRGGVVETVETKEGGSNGGASEGQVVKALAQILGSADSKTALLGATINGTIPDEVYLGLAEHLGELIKAKDQDLENQFEVVIALHESGTISNKIEQYLLLALLEMCEQEEANVEAGDEPTETTAISLPAPIPQSDSVIATGQALEAPAPAPTASEGTRITDLIRSAAGLQAQFGTNLPEEKLFEIRQTVGKLTKEEFSSLRQSLGSAILAQAEVPTNLRQVNVPASLEVVDILLGSRQAELTAAAFIAYDLVGESFRLNHRNEFGRPLMTVSSITLLRNRSRRWLDSHESGLGADELASARKAIATLEGFLLAAADDYTKAAIHRDRATRLRERIILSWIRVLDVVNEELVAAQPATKEGALRQVQGYLEAKRQELASELRLAGSKLLCEAEATIWQVFDLQSATATLQREMAELGTSNYDPLAQRPTLTDCGKQLIIHESERSELVFDYRELSAALDSPELKRRERKKTAWQLDETTSKLEDVDQLITALRPAPPALPALEVRCV